jgi:Sulfotransferase family
MNSRAERVKDTLHPIFRSITGLKLVGDLHERPMWPGLYPPLDPVLRGRLRRVRDAGVLFIHIPKNAGISVSLELYGTPLFHPTVRYYQRVAPDIVRDLPSFAVWRDPVDRFVSAYRFARSGGAPNAPIARAFRNQYQAFTSLDDALDHVETAGNLYEIDHVFRPQFWYVADSGGRIAVDRICLLEDLDQTVAAAGLPGLTQVSRTNLSRPITCEVSDEQYARLRRLYAIDFAFYEALRNDTIPLVLNERVAA